MKTKQPNLPPELRAFVDEDHATFYCDDGDWDLRIVSRDKSDFKDDLPPRAIMIAENGCGDCLFLKTSPAGKVDSKVFVYWHEEERNEVFAKHIKELTARSSPQESPSKKPTDGKAAGPKISVKEFEKALASSDDSVREEAIRNFSNGEFRSEALPALRKALADESVLVATKAADCIARFAPEIASSIAGEKMAQLELYGDLQLLGGKVWSYSGYNNCYSACLKALVKLGSPYNVGFVCTHIGLESPDDLVYSLDALKTIGTPEAIDLLKRAATFWMPELNNAYAKKMKAIVGSAKVTKKK